MSKKPQFTNKEKGYTTPYLNAKKLSGKGDSAVYETEEECKNRTKEMFNVEDVECFWDEENKRYVAGPENTETKSDEVTEEETTGKPEVDEAPETPEETVAAQAESKDSDEVPDEAELTDLQDEAMLEDLEKSADIKPKTAESDFEDQSTDEEPLPSIDGKRTYDLESSRGLQSLTTLFKKWGWEDDEEALIDKVREEHKEFLDGGREKASLTMKPGNTTVEVIGTSTISECITNAIVHFKYANEFHDITPIMMAKLMHLRHQEQYDRYHA